MGVLSVISIISLIVIVIVAIIALVKPSLLKITTTSKTPTTSKTSSTTSNPPAKAVVKSVSSSGSETNTVKPVFPYTTLTPTTTTPPLTTTSVPMRTTLPPSMSVWLDASSSGSWVSGSWYNLASSSNPAISFSSSSYTGTWSSTSLVSSAINGKPALQFSGTNALYIPDGPKYTNGITFFVVFQPTATDTYRTLLSRTNVSTNAAPLDMYNECRVLGNGTTAAVFYSSVNLNLMKTNQPYLFSFRVDGSTGAMSEWLDGDIQYYNMKMSGYGDTATALYIGGRGGSNPAVTSFTGYMGEVRVFNSVLPDSSVASINSEMMTKWGLTPVLPYSTTISARYVRLEQPIISDYLNIIQIQAFTPSGAFITPTTATACSEHSSHPATNAIDGMTSSIYHSPSVTPAQCLQIDLGVETSIGKVVIVNRQDSNCQIRAVGCVVKLYNGSSSTPIYTSPQLDSPQNVYEILLSEPTPTFFFTIATTSGLSAWLDASSTAAWFSSQWKNFVVYNNPGNAGVFTGTWTAANWVADAINGMPAIQFNGTNGLSIPNAAQMYSAGITLFVVFKPTATSTYRTLLARDNSSVPSPFDIYANARYVGNGTTFANYTANYYTSPVNLNSLTLNQTYVFCFRINATGTTAKLSEWLDGGLKYKDATLGNYSDAGTVLYIGTRQDKATSFTGYMGEIMVYKSALSDTEVNNVNAYLSQKWNPLALTLWFKFDSGDLSGYSVANYGSAGNGTLNSTGASISTTVYRVGTGSLALSASYMTIPDPGFTIRGVTITAWFKYPSNTDGWVRLFEFGNGPSSDNFGYCPQNGLFVKQGNADTTTQQVGGGYADNTWHHVGITMTYAASGSATSTINIYIDGNSTAVYSTTTGYYPLNVARTQCYIGKSNWTANPNATGYVDDFRLYNCVMTAEEVRAIYTG